MKVPALLLTLFSASAAADVTLVRDGVAQAVIIVPDGLHKQVRKPAEQPTSDGVSVPLAAGELADYLHKISGARPQIATETQTGINAASRTILGPCRANADLAPKPEEFVITTREADVYLRGGDSGPNSGSASR